MATRLGIIGGGNMGLAIVRGTIEAGVLEPQAIVVAEIDPARRAEVARTGCSTVEEPKGVVDAEEIMLAVKPQVFSEANEKTNAVAAAALALTASDNLKNGLIDAVIKEPMGGAHRDPAAAAKSVQNWIVDRIRELKRSKPETLVQRRYEKLRKIGAIAWQQPPGGETVATTTTPRVDE